MAWNRLAKRIIGAVMGAYLPLRTQVFKPVKDDVLAAWIDIAFQTLEIARKRQRNTNVVAGIAERTAPQQCYLALIVAGDVKVSFHRRGEGKRSNLFDRVVEREAGVREAVRLQTSRKIRAREVVTNVACDPGCPQ